MNVVKASFRPEFLNRIDDVILFQRLAKEDMTGIVNIQIGRLQKLLAERRIAVDLDDEAIAWLANKGYEPAYGARPLKRVIQTALQDPLAEKVLAGEIHDGMTVKVTAASDRLIFKPKAGGKPRVVDKAA
jgi:ATP-dependent Clp protease ATP-binding subunit ClpB